MLVYVNCSMSIRSIARELGVSATAVSLALKDSTRVSPALRERVRRAARAAGHVPNARLAELMQEVRRSAQPAYRGTLGVIALFPEEEPWRERPEWGHLGRFAAGARARAAELGYKLEHFWLKRPGMTPARLRAILEARGIAGLLCLGSLEPEEMFPVSLRRFAVVTQGASVVGPLHRVQSHFAADARRLYGELLRRGYRRPGLCILATGDRRTDHLYTATLLELQTRLLVAPAVPILLAETWDKGKFGAWFDAHRPDAIVLHQHGPFLAGLEGALSERRLRVPRDIGLALLDLNPNPSRYAGVIQNFERMGATAVEMLLGRILLREFSAPPHPKIEVVLGMWNEGRTLRAPVKSRRSTGRR
ncbi:MAG: LacI family DNA-binding transcriptional regulator [Opitutaceae bacterium]|nr:LacI family DNA-binding transcriptional regulator [Opitutaceae bacterium]